MSPGGWTSRSEKVFASLLAFSALLMARPAAADFVLSDPSKKIYHTVAAAAGSAIETGQGVRIAGPLVSNGDVLLKSGSSVDGDVTAAGTISGGGTVSGASTQGAAPAALPSVFDEAAARSRADRVVEGNTTFTADQRIDDVLFVKGDARFRAGVTGTGTIIAAGDILFDNVTGGPPNTPDPAMRMSFIALRDISVGKGRALRGVLLARGDITFDKEVSLLGVAVAGRKLWIKMDGALTFENFDREPPRLTVLTPRDGLYVRDPLLLVSGTAVDESGIAELTVNGLPAQLEDGRFTATVSLQEGVNSMSVLAADLFGRFSSAEVKVILDTRPPGLEMTAPAAGQVTNQGEMRVAGSASDLALARVEVEGVEVPVTAGRFETIVPLPEGRHDLTVAAVDRAGNVSQVEREVFRMTLPVVTLSAPEDLSFLAATTTDVAGTVSGPATLVTVNGVTAEIVGTSFVARGVPLIEGGNILTAVATSADGRMGTASLNVVRDLFPPRVTVQVPRDGSVVFTPAVTVLGLVNDIVAGTVNASEATVLVNGRQATVANRSFLAAEVPLALGDNVLTVVATDMSGNSGETRITVRREEPTVSRIVLVSGDRQEAVIGTPLPQPLVVQLVDSAGLPAAGRPVIFKVRGSDGSLDGGRRQIAVTTDASGKAAARLTLGLRAGAGNQTVEVTAVGFRGPAVFVTTALPGEPARLLVDSGNQQVGVAGQALPRPLVAVVTDEGFNRLEGYPVRFSVVRGQGRFDTGERELLAVSDSDGRVIVPFLLDPEEGVANNVVEARIDGIEEGPVAAFFASGKGAGDPVLTSISGVVLDNSNLPITGATLRILGSTRTAATDAQGQFRIASAPVGTVKLIVDGTTVDRPGTWPDLEFVLTTVPGRDNTIGMPIYLLPLDQQHGLYVDEVRGGTLTLPDVPGFALEIAPGSLTLPGGGRSGVVSVTVVHSDKVPMVPNFGQQPRFIVTIQPAGARFEPPARLTLPNVEGLRPGEVTELYSFDHDLGHFVSIGPATVSEDGAVITANPGVGIIKAGWHCGGNPAASGTPHACPSCMTCSGSQCVPGCALPETTSIQSLVKATQASCGCNDGNACTVNDSCLNGGCEGTPRTITRVDANANGAATGRVFVGQKVDFDAEVSANHCSEESLTYAWNLGNGESSTIRRPQTTYKKPGNYLVTLDVKCQSCDQARDFLGVVVSCPAVRITRTEPDVSTLCPGCSMQFYAETEPEAPVQWLIPPGKDLDGKATVTSGGLLRIAPDAKRGEVVVRATVADGGEDCHDERAIFVFVPPENTPRSEGLGTTPAEEKFAARHLVCALKMLNLRISCAEVMNRIFPGECRLDPNAGNAFLHAYCSCETARRCGGVEVAKELWDAHEETHENACQNASMDFHNNEQGRLASQKAGSCTGLVLQAMREGRLRWIYPKPSDYSTCAEYRQQEEPDNECVP